MPNHYVNGKKLKDLNVHKVVIDMNDVLVSKDDKVKMIDEALVELYINNEKKVLFMCTPLNIKELSVGHLIARGIIKSVDDIVDIKVIEEKLQVFIEVKNYNEEKYSVPNIILSGCSSATFSDEYYNMDGVKSDYSVNMDEVVELSTRLVEEAEIYKISGGIHGCAIKTKDEAFCLREDIGRHNAVDKAIGMMNMRYNDLSNSIIASTGRISLDMILKALAVNAPIVTSLSVPSNLAVKLAEKFGITIVGRVKSKSPIVYTNKERIKN